MDVLIRVNIDDKDFQNAILSVPEFQAQRVEARGIDGGADSVAIVCALGIITLKTLTRILKCYSERAKSVNGLSLMECESLGYLQTG